MDFKNISKYSPDVLRFGIGFVILWFGLNEVLNPVSWVAWIPDWASFTGLSKTALVYINGGFEIIASVLLLVGAYVRIASLLLALHMLLIVFDIGLSAIGVRDLGLAMALFSLAMGFNVKVEGSSNQAS